MASFRSAQNIAECDSPVGELPSIPGPLGEPPLVEEVKPLGRPGAAIHLAGATLNVIVTGRAVIFLISHVGVIRREPRLALGAFVAGTYIADLVSGILHWTFDTWFDEQSGPLMRMVYLVREHHLRPARIFRYRLRDEAGLLSWFALILAGPLYRASQRSPLTPRRYALALTGVVIAGEVTLMLEFHKWGHRVRRGRLPRLLQTSRLLLSPETHLQHHSADHDTNYCLINGVADQTLGRIGFFRGLEALVSALTGARPRSDDIEWARRYGRPR